MCVSIKSYRFKIYISFGQTEVCYMNQKAVLDLWTLTPAAGQTRTAGVSTGEEGKSCVIIIVSVFSVSRDQFWFGLLINLRTFRVKFTS